MYVQAANLFKVAKNWSAAGSAFYEGANLQLKSGSRHDAASYYADAGHCYKKSNPEEAINCLIKAIELFVDMGRFYIAAKHHFTVAEIYERKIVDVEKAIPHYQQAADYYEGEESHSSARNCLLNVARCAAQLEQYDNAIEIYEKVATSSLESPVLRHSAKEYFFWAALCHLCVDRYNAQLAIAKYEKQHPDFTDSRECKLVKTLIERVEDDDVDGFTNAVTEFNSISHLDQWHTNIILRIKKLIQENTDLR